MADDPDQLLERYRSMRDFTRTAEPAGGSLHGLGPRFVVQEHHARRLHYDLRLEVDGVLKSWAVPKGPSYDPGVRRLAMETEDHPLGYGRYEGVIPKGEYGGGTVIVWDQGTYTPLSSGSGPDDGTADTDTVMREAIARGRVGFWLEGHRLRGGWTLVRMERAEEKGTPWLLFKRRDREADPRRDAIREHTSVLSGRTVEEVEAQEGTPEEVARRLRRTRQATHGEARA